MNPSPYQQSVNQAHSNPNQQYGATGTQDAAPPAGQQYQPQPTQPYPPSQYQGGNASHPAGASQQYGAPPGSFVQAPTAGTAPASTNPPPSQQTIGGATNNPPPPQHQGAYNPPPQQTSHGAPSIPPPPQQSGLYQGGNYPPPQQQGNYAYQPASSQGVDQSYGDEDLSNPVHYIRDPHKLIAYLVPFPKPHLHGIDPSSIPERFLIYTPPPPPLSKPVEGEKEGKVHKVQRKWQEEVRAAKTSTAKTVSWKGVKSKVTKGISYAMGLTKDSNIDFLNRIPGTDTDEQNDPHAHDGVEEGDTTHRTVGLEEMILVYPPSFGGTEEQVRAEFVNSMMRSKTKAQRDAVIATGLLPVSGAMDLLATLVWPFGGLLEIDSVWAYSSIRGAKAARSVTKRLASSSATGLQPHDGDDMSGDKLRLTFKPSPRIEVLHRYLETRCAERDAIFVVTGPKPTETEVLYAIGWEPSQNGGATQNWEDEQWETIEVTDDLKSVMKKGAREWDKWCKEFAKDPKKALKS